MNSIYRLLGISDSEDIAIAIRSFSLRQKLVWFFLIVAFFAGALNIVREANSRLLAEIPSSGGVFTEGIIGVPRFINPVLATSDADKDLTSLVYSGLMRLAPDGSLIPDLAEKYELSEDGLVYDFTLRNGLTWQDGTPFSSEDIEFTIQKIQDPGIKSPKHISWKGVAIELPSDTEIRFRLKQPFPEFLENATIGILPKHLWKGANNEVFPFSTFNSRPIGSGPYQIEDIATDSSGIPRSYTLVPFEDFALGAPKIAELTIRFYGTEDDLVSALKVREIHAASALSPEIVDEFKGSDLRIEGSTLPRVFAVFFNQNQAQQLASKNVRKALDLALDKEKIVQTTLKGYGIAISGPIPPGSIGWNPDRAIEKTKTEDERIATARELLAQDGWVYNTKNNTLEKTEKKGKISTTIPLSFSLATGDAPGLKEPAELIVNTWQKLGVKVDLKVFEKGDLNQSVIRPRKYDALFFGEIVGRDPDLFSFWHSSQRNDPGLNIALYTSIQNDKVLSDIRITSDIDKRISLYDQSEKLIRQDMPATFVYSPQFLYLVPKNVKKTGMASIVTNSERFSNINEWYITTQNVWKIFLK